jgi:hypothetical protein
MDEQTADRSSSDLTGSGGVVTLSYNPHPIARYLAEECSRESEKNGEEE